MDLTSELERIAEVASTYAADHEKLEGVLAAEASPGERLYICAYGSTRGARTWLALDEDGNPIESRSRLRDAISITALCELAEETAGGGELAELRSQLLTLRLTENPPGIDEAEAAALALESALAVPPRIASPAYLDSVGNATRRLEQALGNNGSPFTNAMQTAIGSVESLTAEVEAAYKRRLS
jgi:hypothetical protein